MKIRDERSLSLPNYSIGWIQSVAAAVMVTLSHRDLCLSSSDSTHDLLLCSQEMGTEREERGEGEGVECQRTGREKVRGGRVSEWPVDALPLCVHRVTERRERGLHNRETQTHACGSQGSGRLSHTM